MLSETVEAIPAPTLRPPAVDLLVKGYLRIKTTFYRRIPPEIISVIMNFSDPYLFWIIDDLRPRILSYSSLPLTVQNWTDKHYSNHYRSEERPPTPNQYPSIIDSTHNSQFFAVKSMNGYLEDLSSPIAATQPNYDLIIAKNNKWNTIDTTIRYILSDILSTAAIMHSYTVKIDNTRDFNTLNDIQWLVNIVISNPSKLTSLTLIRLSILNFLNFNYFCTQLLSSSPIQLSTPPPKQAIIDNPKFRMIRFESLEEITIGWSNHFTHECCAMLIDVIAKQCPKLSILQLWRTAINDLSCAALIAFLTQHSRHPLWQIDIEFCKNITDYGVNLWLDFLKTNPSRNVFVKCTGRNLFPDDSYNEHRIAFSIYPSH